MKHRSRSAGNDEGPSGDPLRGGLAAWEDVVRFALGSAVVVSVTLGTGSVQAGILAVSAVATAARIAPRRSGLV